MQPTQTEQNLLKNIRAGAQSREPATAVPQSSLTSICCREKGVSMAGRKGRAVASLIAVLIAGALIGGCSKEYNDKRGKGDAPVQGRRGDNTAAEVFNMPDGFGNLATKCTGPGRRAYVTTKSVHHKDDETEVTPANAVIVNDPQCRTTR
ncbi:hypothetical protein [Streptomyces sp. NPDC001089]